MPSDYEPGLFQFGDLGHNGIQFAGSVVLHRMLQLQTLPALAG